jgi:hypothetical protein
MNDNFLTVLSVFQNASPAITKLMFFVFFRAILLLLAHRTPVYDKKEPHIIFPS